MEAQLTAYVATVVFASVVVTGGIGALMYLILYIDEVWNGKGKD